MKRVFWVLALVLVLTQPAAAAENQGSLKIDLDTGELPVTCLLYTSCAGICPRTSAYTPVGRYLSGFMPG